MGRPKKTDLIEKSWNEIREDKLKVFKSDNFKHISEPTYKFNVGDEVAIGNLYNVHVIASFENNKIYEIEYSYTNTNYGNPYEVENQHQFVSWINIRPMKNSNISLIQNEDLNLSYSSRDIGDIFGKVYHFGVDFNPDYQRDFVWDINDKVALIDSIFNNVDIGKFVFVHKEYNTDTMYEILDGKQRINAILEYYENRFPYKGLYFNDLCHRDQNHFENYRITEAEVSDITKEQVLRYFLKLNTNGRVMSKEQISKVAKMLQDIETTE